MRIINIAYCGDETVDSVTVEDDGEILELVNVVRCKDCKNYDKEELYCLEMLSGEKEYNFCSHGERK